VADRSAEIKLIPRPGLHSDADLIVYFPPSGWWTWATSCCRERPGSAGHRGYITFLDDVLDVFPEDATFISGHGRDLDAAGVGAYRDT